MNLCNYCNIFVISSFSDFFLYVSPVFAMLFLPDRMAVHFLHYYVYIRTLHFYRNNEELDGIEKFFDHYYQHLAEFYGPKSNLCTVHIHSHLLAQVKRHGCLAMTSCFPRESFLGNLVKLCHGKKFILEQFFTWYRLNRVLSTDNNITVARLYEHRRFDDKYLDESLLKSTREKMLLCCEKKNIQVDPSALKVFGRYTYGLKTFHSLCYSRAGNSISHWVSIRSDQCPVQCGRCFGEVILFFQSGDSYYAFIRHYPCMDKSLSDGLTSTTISPELDERLKAYFHVFHDKQFTYKIVPIDFILNKVIRMPWNESHLSIFTEVDLDWEHD